MLVFVSADTSGENLMLLQNFTVQHNEDPVKYNFMKISCESQFHHYKNLQRRKLCVLTVIGV